MRILISSLELASRLHAFDHTECPILRAYYSKDKLCIESDDYAIDIYCELIGGMRDIVLPQDEVRWDWLEKTLRNITEQPVVLEIGINKLNLILSF